MNSLKKPRLALTFFAFAQVLVVVHIRCITWQTVSGPVEVMAVP